MAARWPVPHVHNAHGTRCPAGVVAGGQVSSLGATPETDWWPSQQHDGTILMKRRPVFLLRVLLCLPLAAAFAATLALWLARPHLDRSIPTYALKGAIPAEFQTTITLYDKDGEPYWTGDGREMYRRNHRQGWDECRFYFARDYPWEYEPESGIWLIGQPDAVNRAREAGWKECSDRLHSLLKTESKVVLQRKVLNWRRREATWVGLGSLIAILLVMAAAAWARRLSIAIGATCAAWVGVMFACRHTWGGGIDSDPPIGLMPFLLILACGLGLSLAAIAIDRKLSEGN